MRLTDDYQCKSEEEEKEEEKEQQKEPDKKELPKNRTKDDFDEFNEWVNIKETGINYELF